jgi:hypothetical protein
MVDKAISAYVVFAHSGPGAIILVALSLGACAAVVLWARQVAHEERRPILAGASVLTALVAGIYALAVAAGWWGGLYFETPFIVQVATLLPLSLAGWVVWLMGYRWLAAHSRYPLAIYAASTLLIIPAVVVADRAEISGGLFLVAADGATWVDALIGVGIMLAPLLLFEGIRRGLERDVLP